MPMTTPSGSPISMFVTLLRPEVGRRLWLLALIAVLLLPLCASAQENVLFNHTRDPKIIAMQIGLALPSATRGFELLQTASAPEELTLGVEAIYDSYKYLRAAHESSRNVQGRAKFADPLVTLRDRRIGRILGQLTWCRTNAGHLIARQPEITATCMEGLGQAIRDLRVIVATTP